MSTQTATTTADPTAAPPPPFPVIPYLRSTDAAAAARWLVDAFGFTAQELFPNADDVQHAELRFGPDGLVMLGPCKAGDDPLALRTPRQLGGTTHGCCLVTVDPDAAAARALAAGAEVVRPLADTAHGSREVTVRDPLDGHLWTLGTYRPLGAGHLTPYLLYADAPAAIAWLRRAFALETALQVPGEERRVVHAELRCGTGMVMVGSDFTNDLGLAAGRRLAGWTQGIYVPVADAAAHHARAVAAGAEVILPLAEMPYGSREYTCRDLEGNLWSFGTYLA